MTTNWTKDVSDLLNDLDAELEGFMAKTEPEIDAAEAARRDARIKGEVAVIIADLKGEQAWRVGNMLYEALNERPWTAKGWAK